MGLVIHTREYWKARAARPRERQNPRNVREFFVHWPGEARSLRSIDTREEEKQEMRDEQAFHMNVRKWADFAYSFAVFQSGRVYRGRGMDFVPAAQEGHNTNTVAVTCVLGPGDKPSDAMLLSLRRLKNHCDERAGRDLVARPHSDVVQTSCPGDALRAIIGDLNRRA